MPRTLYMLVGLPACGKSTWIKKTFDTIEGDLHLENFAVISSDDIIETKARQENATYNDVFAKWSGYANRKIFEDARNWFEYDEEWFQGIIWDQTNLTIKKRKSILNLVPEDWMKIAVVLEQPKPEEWKRRLASREGKIIPESVLEKMSESFERPTLKEGFNSVITWPGEASKWPNNLTKTK